MSARFIFRRATKSLAMLVAFSAGAFAGEASPPNLVLIVADDLGYADTGYQGSDRIATPSIDRIASEGVVFTSGYVSGSVCGPSRAGLITGRYQCRFGSSLNPTIDPSVPNGVPREQPMLSELLAPVGYESIAVGKWHLGLYPGLKPRERGFDEFYGFLSGGHRYFPEELNLPDLDSIRRGDWSWYHTKILHNGQRIGIDEYLTDELSHAAVEFIDRRGDDGPFFVYLAYNAPHGPLQATEPYLDRFAEVENERERTYLAMVSAVDDGVGRVLEALERVGAAENTLVVFISDNGGPRRSPASNAPLRGHKGSLYEGGIRVPFAARWPAEFPAGGVVHQPIIALDIAATIAAAAGVTEAVPHDRPFDGIDLRGVVAGSTAAERPLFWRQFHNGRDPEESPYDLAVRRGRYKLIETRPGPANAMLFDLDGDIAERENLIDTDIGREVAAELRKLLDAWERQLVPPAYPSLATWSNP